MIDLADFENWAIETKENKTAILIDEMNLARFAVAHDRAHKDEDPPPRLARWLAHLWGRSTTHSVNVLAQMRVAFDDDDIPPDAPLSLYKAAMETGNPRYALRLATDVEFRHGTLGEEYAKIDKKGHWSSRDVRDHFDILRGKHLSSATFCGPVVITEWDVPTGRVAAEGLPISGDRPQKAEMMIREILDL